MPPGPAPVPPRPRPHQGSRLKLHGHVLQEGHEVGRAPLHLIQVLELVVLFLGILWGGDGSETEGDRGGACGLILAPLPRHFPERIQAGGGRGADGATAGMVASQGVGRMDETSCSNGGW